MADAAADSMHSWADEPEPEPAQPSAHRSGSSGGGAVNGKFGGARRAPGMAKPQRPDDSETRMLIQKLQETIQQHKQRAEEITASIDAKRSGRAKASPQQAALKNKLGELRTHLGQLTAQRQALQSQLDVATDAQERTRESLKHLKTGTRFTRVENIDEQIAELEARLAGSSVNLSGGGLAGEERQRVERQLSALHRSRSHVEELRRSASGKDKDSGTVVDLRARVARLDDQIEKAHQEEAALREQLAGFKAVEAEQSGDIPDLIRERDECKAICRAAYSKVVELRQALDEQWAAFKHQNALFHQQQVEKRERHQEYLRRKAAREAAQQAQEGQQEEAEAEVEAEAGSGESAGGAEGATDAAAEGAANGRPPEVRANGRGVSGRGGRGAERHGGRGRGGRGRGRGQLAGEAEATPQTEGGVEASVDAAA